MAVESARESAGDNRNTELTLMPQESYDHSLLVDLLGRASLSNQDELLNEVLADMERIFLALAPKRRPTPALHGPRLIREHSTCPDSLPEDVLGLLNVGLIYHNDKQIDLAVAAYQEALTAWIAELPRSHNRQMALMVIACAVGGALESGLRDEAALAVYALGVRVGSQLPEATPELGYCCACLGAVLFHLGVYDPALQHLQQARKIRMDVKNVAAERCVKIGRTEGPRTELDELAIVENNIGACFMAIEDNVHGMESYKTAYAVLRALHPPHHAYVQSVVQNIDRARLNMANHEIDMTREARPIFRAKKEKKAKKGKGKKKKKK